MPTTTYLTSAGTFVARGHLEVSAMSERCVLVWDRSIDAITQYESLACVELGHRAGCEHSEVPMISRPIGPCSVCSEPVQQGQQYVNLRKGVRHTGCKRSERHQHSWTVGVEGAEGWTAPGTADASARESCPCGAASSPPRPVGAQYIERAGRGLVRAMGVQL